MESVRDRKAVKIYPYPPVAEEVPAQTAQVTLVHIWDTLRRYEDTPIGPLFLSPGAEFVVGEDVVEWFLSQGKTYGGCCGSSSSIRRMFQRKE